uniref:Uncharacterized protein n=1 Tax=Arundo donax TaxID=35708 RepID=A0A0A9DGJ4_ARUDO
MNEQKIASETDGNQWWGTENCPEKPNGTVDKTILIFSKSQLNSQLKIKSSKQFAKNFQRRKKSVCRIPSQNQAFAQKIKLYADC